MQHDNPYESSPAAEPPFKRDNLTKLAFRGFCLGAVYGLLFGGLTAGFIAFVIGKQWISVPEFVPGRVNTAAMIAENTVLSAVVGAVLGKLGCGTFGLLLTVPAALWKGSNAAAITLVSSVCCGLFGSLLGCAEAVLLSGSGFDGTPIYVSAIATSGLIGFVGGTLTGLLIGRYLSSMLWGPTA